MSSHFWQGFEKKADAAGALKGAARAARTFGKGALVGGAITAAGIGLHHAAQTPTVQPMG